ncbi:hypothetical protein EXN66_Car006442 [Channa argus]|uniref:Uncharacterized protein n=1 Tax=Channa argus TaxID=215402 RepID=A0A6G1PKM2_CHAAH|nr:hypothetical protein EXN66_Car006442 [Channa argus]
MTMRTKSILFLKHQLKNIKAPTKENFRNHAVENGSEIVSDRCVCKTGVTVSNCH